MEGAAGAALDVVAGREAVVLVDDASDARGAAREVEVSAAGRVVRGRFAVVVDEGASEALGVVLPGDDRVVAAGTAGVLRTVGFLFSSPDVTEDRSGSASDDAVLLANAVLLTAVPGAGRVGGLFKLDPTVLVRAVALASGFDAVEARVVEAAAAGRRAPAAAVLLVAAGRRGGTGSLGPGAGALEAMVRRAVDVGVEGAVDFFRCGLAAAGELAMPALSAAASLAGVGASIAGLASGAACADQGDAVEADEGRGPLRAAGARTVAAPSMLCSVWGHRVDSAAHARKRQRTHLQPNTPASVSLALLYHLIWVASPRKRPSNSHFESVCRPADMSYSTLESLVTRETSRQGHSCP